MELKISAPPAWLRDLIDGSYNTSRTQNRSFQDFSRFCIDCRGNPFRDVDMSSHSGHTVIRVCKCSRHYAVRYENISKLLDCSGIHSYVINFNNIVVLKSRQGRHRERCGCHLEACKICGWKFPPASPDSVFCSLGCKYQNSAVEEKPPMMEEEERDATLTVVEEPVDQMEKTILKFEDLGPNAANSLRRKRRKGIPSRAPLFGAWYVAHLHGVPSLSRQK
ncbi:hypothetical protein Ancab_003721 [Ancistrocladus abbreviatus]